MAPGRVTSSTRKKSEIEGRNRRERTHTRTPPSHGLYLPPRSGIFAPAAFCHFAWPPLSEVITILLIHIANEKAFNKPHVQINQMFRSLSFSSRQRFRTSTEDQT
eukprot:COSAG06_NODE_4006_length_4669_cov_3.911160_4_plen_105_part_00